MDIRNNDTIKNKREKISELFKYTEERKYILQQLYDILGIAEDNKIFYWNDINEEKQKKIMDLSCQCKMYFNCKHWTVFSTNKISNPHVSLIRSLLRDMKIKTSYIYVLNDLDIGNTKKRGLKILN